MPSFALPSYLLALAVLLITTATASPLTPRDPPPQWSFDLFPARACNGTGDFHAGSGSTGCRADLSSVASAYRLTSVPEDCRIAFFDNTMCDTTELSDIASVLTSIESCRLPGLGRRYGSYRVTCDDGSEALSEDLE